MFINLILKARRLKRRQQDLAVEKQTAFDEFRKHPIKLTARQKSRRRCIDLLEILKRPFRFPIHSPLHRTCLKIRHDGTCENFTAKSVAGFIGGFCLTYIFFMFFVLQLNFKLSTATIMCSIFGSILTIGLAFSYKIRCIVLLVLPQFFSKKGRQALLAYAFILAITGPAKNTLNNMSILGENLACGQEQLKDAVRQIWQVIKKPFYAIKDAIKAVVQAIKVVVKKIKEILISIKRIIMSLVKVIKSAFQFISRILNICNKEIGTPFQRCAKVFENAITDCNAKLGPMFNWLCNITYLVKTVCYIVKPFDLICIIIDFVKDTVSVVVTKVKQFIRHIRTMFYVRIKFSHSYHFESNRSKSLEDITTGIVTEIKQRSSGLIKIFDFMSSAASLFFIFMVFKVLYYRHKFLTNERFDNKFITKNFRQIDLRRAQLGLETVLPLNHRERQKYITTSSMRLVKREKSQLSEAAMILLMATLKLLTHMATDYSLYWIMKLIRYYGRFQSKLEAPNMPTITIQGEGFLAGLLKSIVKAFQPVGINLEIDTIPCLPDPITPDYDRYIQIVSLLVLCWFLAIFEPYGLRLRHTVMCYYHPHRAKERAIWLYNNILRQRSSFLKFARRQLRRKVKGDSSISKVTFMDFLRAKLHCTIFVLILGTKKQLACLLCGEVMRENGFRVFIKCQTPDCPGLFCEQCFADLQNLCTVCLDPIQYGDLSDISEEKDSSEDEAKRKKSSRKSITAKSSAESSKSKKAGFLTKLFKRRKTHKKKIKVLWKCGKCKKPKSSDYDTSDTDDDDQRARLIRTKSDKYKNVKSDLSDDDATSISSDYSYTYQEQKNILEVQPDPPPPRHSHFEDTEKQSVTQYASMQDFVEDDVLFDTKSELTSHGRTSMDHLFESEEAMKSPKSKTSRNDTDNVQSSTSESSPAVMTYTSSRISELEYDLNQQTESMMYIFKRPSSKFSIDSYEMNTLQKTPSSSGVENNLQHSPNYSSKVSETTFISSPARAESIPPDLLHPEVPKLNLDFVNRDESISSKSTRFVGRVTYHSISEKDGSNESSSLISSLQNPPGEAYFQLKLAQTPSVNIDPSISPMSSNYPYTESSDLRKRALSSKEHTSTTSSNITDSIDSEDFYLQNLSETDGTSVLLGSDSYTDINKLSSKESINRYNQRIKDYYRSIKTKSPPQPNIRVYKRTGGRLTKFLNYMFRYGRHKSHES